MGSGFKARPSGQVLVRAHQAASKTKVFPSPLSPVKRLRRSPKENAILGLGPRFSNSSRSSTGRIAVESRLDGWHRLCAVLQPGGQIPPASSPPTQWVRRPMSAPEGGHVVQIRRTERVRRPLSSPEGGHVVLILRTGWVRRPAQRPKSSVCRIFRDGPNQLYRAEASRGTSLPRFRTRK